MTQNTYYLPKLLLKYVKVFQEQFNLNLEKIKNTKKLSTYFVCSIKKEELKDLKIRPHFFTVLLQNLTLYRNMINGRSYILFNQKDIKIMKR